MTIFVLGVTKRSLPLGKRASSCNRTLPDTHEAVDSRWTIYDVLKDLRRRHLIPDLSQIRPVAYFNPFRLSPLSESSSLEKIGVKDLSVLHIRFSLLGGSSRKRISGKV